MTKSTRTRHEIAHGKLLAQGDPVEIWGWGTPAGHLRAQRRAALIAAGARLGPGVLALEIGCGTGMFSELFLASGANLLAVDISGELLAQARARRLPEERIRFLEMPFEECRVEGPFDAVIGSSILHHLEVEAALEKIFGLLKPGGYLSFAEPNMLNPQVWLERKLSFLPCFWYVSPDETAFVRPSLQRLLARAGFTEIAITPFDWLHPQTTPAWIKKMQKLGERLERTPFLREFAGSLLIRARRPQN
jgi:SAM-dependent methyltransferase